MTPEERAMVKRRASMACREMALFGFELARTKDALKRLLKLLDCDWDAIEANNYSLLVDALVASPPRTDDSAGEVDFEVSQSLPPASSRSEAAPVEKRRDTVSSGEAPLPKQMDNAAPMIHDSFEDRYWPRNAPASADTNQKRGVVAPLSGSLFLKKPKPEPDVEPPLENVCGGCAVDNLGDKPTHDSSSMVTVADDVNWAMVPVIEPEDQATPAMMDCRNNNNTETSKDGSICNQSSHISKLDCSTSPHFSGNNERASKDNLKESVAEPNVAGMNLKHPDNGNIDQSICSVTTMEIASSSNGKVKMCLSVNNKSTNFHMPHIETVIDAVESKCLEMYNIQQLDFSIMNIMKEVCETYVEVKKSGI